ncbi:helix-turn-helix domain-containing protein [Actinomadura terrae]|uniref:helix-turn-helix domain-containing protein n=1 Tax=Actinomadura terrae TaxID=604353 RepID=UPI0027E025FE|nr:helix-turn-helix domain-containing protein [Actinomadura terrae]
MAIIHTPGRATHDNPGDLLTRDEVADLFRVEPSTVSEWARRGRLRSIRTPGGARRFRAEVVYAQLQEAEAEGTTATESGEASAEGATV